MYYQIDNNGFFLGVVKATNEAMEFSTEVPISGNFVKFKFNGTEWVEGATAEEIEQSQVVEQTDLQTRITQLETELAEIKSLL